MYDKSCNWNIKVNLTSAAFYPGTAVLYVHGK